MAVTRILTGGVANNSITLAKMAHGTDGNIITYDAAGAPAAVATGTSGHVLTSGGAGVAPTFQAGGGGTPDDNSVTLAKMASGTDGNIISYDASGNPVAIATGTDGQVLTSTGAGSPPAFETAAGGGGAWTLLSSITVSSAVATIDMEDDFDNTYKAYKIIVTNLSTASSSSAVEILMKISGSYVTAGYWYKKYLNNSSTSTGATNASEITTGIFVAIGSEANAAMELVITPGGTNTYPRLSWRGLSGGNTTPQPETGACTLNNAGQIQGVRFQVVSGVDFDVGTISLIGLT
jgi:hypothetical protein